MSDIVFIDFEKDNNITLILNNSNDNDFILSGLRSILLISVTIAPITVIKIKIVTNAMVTFTLSSSPNPLKDFKTFANDLSNIEKANICIIVGVAPLTSTFLSPAAFINKYTSASIAAITMKPFLISSGSNFFIIKNAAAIFKNAVENVLSKSLIIDMSANCLKEATVLFTSSITPIMLCLIVTV